ncbi:DUF4476 domain-containing protein [Bdellovibrio sp. HCB288]|uniref:DUF4476 domain-containing protein n=1 Tax=Bdellovibrio sp. HCB288 TaxID=3394355 RepID=UPI0039B4D68A
MHCLIKLVLTLTLASFVTACSDSSETSGNNPTPKTRVRWSSIPSEYNPSSEDYLFTWSTSVDTLKINLFGFNDDVEVIYSNDIPEGRGVLRIFKVFKGSASWGTINPQVNKNVGKLVSYGSYSCSINISNGQINSLEGGCYIRLQVFLPAGSELEVYNVGELITKRFKGMPVEDFLESVNKASFDSDKAAVISAFLDSYRQVGKTPALTSHQLGTVIREFMASREKFSALRNLHHAVNDRENLGRMIDDVFNYFDREEARRIVGI